MKRSRSPRLEVVMAIFAIGPGGGTVLMLRDSRTLRTRRVAKISSPSSRLARRISERLQSSDYFALRQVECQVVEDVVILEGRLRSQHLKQVAQAIAMEEVGSEGIDNRIEVRTVPVIASRPGFGGPGGRVAD